MTPLSFLLCLWSADPAALSWTQWGGPNRNFQIEARGLASSWPAAGPKRLWNRVLGEGYSMILADQGVLYTMYRNGSQEVVIAMQADSGKTLWEYAYAAPFRSDAADLGHGPHGTPLLVGDRLFTPGVTGLLHCLDKKTGKVLWSHNLWKEFGGTPLIYGYASSPLAYRDTVIVTAGGRGHALICFRQSDGSVVWQKQSFTNAYTSPILINVDGLEQVAAVMADTIFAVNPINGDMQWSHPHAADYGLNVSTLHWGAGNLLFASSAYNAGSRVLKLTRSGNRTEVQELWRHYRLHVHHGNVIRLGEWIYGSSGHQGPKLLTAVEAATGKIAWQQRQFPKASLLQTGDKVILLDEDGTLALATLSPKGVKVISQTSVLSKNAWTAPSLAGTRLYLRDRRTALALELGRK